MSYSASFSISVRGPYYLGVGSISGSLSLSRFLQDAVATLPGSVVVWPGTIVSLCNIRVPKLKPDHARATLGREKDMVGGDAEEAAG